MFIAHHLMTLGHQFSKNLPTNISSTFVDLVPKVRKLGAEHFLQQLAQQKKIMTVYLEGAKGKLDKHEKNNCYFHYNVYFVLHFCSYSRRTVRKI